MVQSPAKSVSRGRCIQDPCPNLSCYSVQRDFSYHLHQQCPAFEMRNMYRVIPVRGVQTSSIDRDLDWTRDQAHLRPYLFLLHLIHITSTFFFVFAKRIQSNAQNIPLYHRISYSDRRTIFGFAALERRSVDSGRGQEDEKDHIVVEGKKFAVIHRVRAQIQVSVRGIQRSVHPSCK